jgi:translocation and assembly module TamB
MRRAVHWVFVSLGAVIGVIALLLIGGTVWLRTELGRHWLTATLSSALTAPDQRVALIGVEGPLPLHWRIQRIDLADRDGTWLSLHDVVLDLDAGALLRGTGRIETLSAASIEVARAPVPSAEPSPSGESFSLPRLPLGIELDRLAVGRLDLAPAVAGDAVALAINGEARLHAGSARVQLQVQRIDGTPGLAALHVVYGPAAGNADVLDLDLHAAEPTGSLLQGLFPGGERLPLAIDLAGTGPLATWHGRLDVLAGAAARIGADLAAARKGDDVVLTATGNAAVSALLPAAWRAPIGEDLRFDLAGTFASAGAIGLDKAEIILPAAKLDATGHYDPHGDVVTGRLTVEGDLAPFSMSAGETLGGHTTLTAIASGTLDRPVIGVVLDGAGLAVGDLGVKVLGAKIDTTIGDDGRIHLVGAGQFNGLSSQGAPPPADMGNTVVWSLDLNTDSQARHVALTKAVVNGSGLDVDASGHLDGTALAGHMRIAARDLERFAALAGTAIAGNLQVEADAVSPDGKSVEATLAGTLASFHLGVPAVDAVLGRDVTIAANGKRDDAGRIDVPGFKLTGSNGTLDASGSLDPAADAVQAHATLALPRLQPIGVGLGTPLDGALSVVADVQGATKDPRVTVKLVGTALGAGTAKLDQLDATLIAENLAQKTAKLTASLTTRKVKSTVGATITEAANNTLAVKDLVVTGPGTKAKGALTVDLATKRAVGTLDASIADLGAWAPVVGEHLAGTVQMALKLTNNGGQGIDGSVQAENLAVGADAGVQHLRLAVRLADALGHPRGTVDFDAVKLRAAEASMDGARLHAVTDQAGVFDFTLNTSGNVTAKPVTVTAGGRLRLDTVGQELDLARLDGKFADLPFRLDRPLAARRRGAAIKLAGLGLALGTGRITGDAGYDGRALDLTLNGDKLPIATFARLGGNRDVGGTLSLTVALSGPLAGPRGRAVVSVPDLKLAAATHPELPAVGLDISAELAGDVVDFKGRAEGPKDSAALGFSGSLPVAFQASGGVSLRQAGAVRGKLEGQGRLDALSELIPLGEDRLSGRFAIDLSVGGTLASPQAGGKLTVNDAEYDNNLSGMTLRGLQVEIAGNQQAFVVRRFEANDGGTGHLGGEGTVDLAAPGGPALNVTASLKSFAAARRDEITAVLDGDAHVSGFLRTPQIGAKFTVQRADINIPEQLPASVAQLDVVRIDSRNPAAARRPETKVTEVPAVVALDLHLHVPGRAFVRGRGLDSEWKGDVTIAGTAAQPAITGEFDAVNGTFALLGQTFTLQRGVVGFAGNAMPTLDVLAQAQTADITAQVQIQGSPTKPTLKLTSIPDLPQDEVLSRVLFGAGVGQITPAQGLQLAQAAASLAGGGPGLLDRLRNFTGLDRLSIGRDPSLPSGGQTGDQSKSSSTSGTTVSGGKYVAPGVYVGVDQGISGASTRARVEVTITPHVTVDATAGAATNSTSLGVQYKLDY